MNKKIDNTRWVTDIIFTEEEIIAKIKEIAEWINIEYAESKNLVFVGLLKGCIPFLAELIKHITVSHSLDFMIVSSYHGNTKSSDTVKVVLDLDENIADKDVLIVEDIVDSGITLKKVSEILLNKNPKSLKIVTLIDKKVGRKINFEVNKYGFEVPEGFLVGYGLDVKEKLRNLPFIGIFDQSKLDEL